MNEERIKYFFAILSQKRGKINQKWPEITRFQAILAK
jgi:hypothetical protein